MRTAITLLSSVIVMTLTTSRSHAEVVWLEAEQFDKLGGWTNDPQFIDQMGSPYLMAIGLGTPVDEAITTISIAKANRYRFWARTKDWVPEHHAGRFQVLVDGKPSKTVFGASGQTGWHWEDGGVFQLQPSVAARRA